MSRDMHSLDLDGGAGWDEHLEHSNRSLRCLEQITELLQGEEVEPGVCSARLTPHHDCHFLVSNWFLCGSPKNIHAL